MRQKHSGFIQIALGVLCLLVPGTAVLPAFGAPAALPRLAGPSRVTAHYAGLDTAHATPLALASADFDGDGTDDLAVSYATPQGGRVTILRGNPNSRAPRTPESFAALLSGESAPAFLPDAEVIEVPVRPDFLVAGEFLGHNGPALAVAERGGTAICVFAKDGDGKFQLQQTVNLPGSLTGLGAHRLKPGTSEQILAGTKAETGLALQIYTGSESGLSPIGSTRLWGEATAFAFGNLDGDAAADALILAGGEVSILHGAGLDDSNFQLEPVPVSFPAVSAALGIFVRGKEGPWQMALLDAGGTVHILAPDSFDAQPYTAAEIRARWQNRMAGRGRTLAGPGARVSVTWKEIESFPGVASVDGNGDQPFLFRTRVLGNGADDLLLLGGNRVSVISHADGAAGTVSTWPEPLAVAAAALPVFVDTDARPGMVYAAKGSAALYTLAPRYSTPFTVDTFSDTVDANLSDGLCADAGGKCSLRAAIMQANQDAATDTINVPAGTYTLTLTGTNKETAGETDAYGSLNILAGIVINGAVDGGGNPATIIQAGTTASNGIDKVFSINPNGNLAFDAHLSNLKIQYGKNAGSWSGGSTLPHGFGGGLFWEANGTGNLTLDNCIITQNQTVDGDGGGLAIDDQVGGSGVARINNSTISNNTVREASTGGAGIGGGIFVGFATAIEITGSKIQGNLANQTIGMNGDTTGNGDGGGIYLFGPRNSATQSKIHSSIISGNTATGHGGGIFTGQGLLIDQGTLISGNSGDQGGGIWAGTAAGETLTISQATLTGNTASGSTSPSFAAQGGNIFGNAGTISIAYSRLAGGVASAGSNLYNAGAAVTDSGATWWGTNTPGNTITTAAGSTTYIPYIVLSHTGSPNKVRINQTSTLTASLAKDNNGGSPLASNLTVLANLPVTIGNPVAGALSNIQTTLAPSTIQATATYTAGSVGANGSADATIDQQTVTASIVVLQPPAIAVHVNPAAVATNSPSVLSFTITNGNTVAISVNFTDSLPANLVVATAPGVSNACGGSVTALAGATSISYANSNHAIGSCTIQVNVQSAVDGVYSNGVTVDSSDAGTGNTSSATLTVINPPVLSQAFAPGTIPLNTTSTLTLTLSSSNAHLSLNNVGFTDTLATGLVLATPAGLSNTCGGTASAPDGAGAFSLAGASLAPGATCTISVSVKGTSQGAKSNTVAPSSSDGGTGSQSSATLTVVGPPALTLSFAASSVPLNGKTSLTFTVQNTNLGTALSGVGFTGSLPAALVIATPNGQAGSCGGGTITATAGSSTVGLSSAALAANSSCVFSIDVTGTAAGLQTVTTTAITSVEGGNGAIASANLKVEAPPSITAAFGASSIVLNSTTTLTFTIVNPAANVDALTGVAVSNTLPTGLTVATGSFAACGGTVTTTNPSGIALAGATIAASSQCQFSVTVTGAASGQYTHTTGAATSTNGGTGNTATANLIVAAPPQIAKAFAAASVPVGGTTTVTYSIHNPNSSVTLNGVGFSDTLPAGLIVASTPNLTNTCGGSPSAAAGGSGVSLTGGSLAQGADCALSVSVQGTTAGTKTSGVTVTSTEGGAGNTSSATVTVAAPPSISQSFGASSIPLNGSTSLTFTVQNANPVALTGVAFSETLPAGLIISTPNGLTGLCSGGTITATAGTNTITLAGAGLAAGTSCIFSVNVTGTAAGLQNSTTSNVTSIESGNGATASASLKVEGPPSAAAVFSPAAIGQGTSSSFTITITNPAANADPLSGVGFTSVLPPGLTVTSGSSSVCGGTLVRTAPAGITLSGASVAVNSQCQITVAVTGTTSGAYTASTGAVSSTNGGSGAAATANLTVLLPPGITKAFGAAAIPVGGSTSLTYTIQNPNASVALSGLALGDTLPAGLVVASAPVNTCGGTAVGTAGSSSVSLSGGTLAGGASCTVSLTVQGTAAGVKSSGATITSLEAGAGSTSTASVTVVGPPALSKAFGAAAIPLNGSTSVTFTVQNANAATTLTGIAFTDTLPAGLAVATPNGLTGSCGGGTISATQGGTVVSLSGATLVAGGSCSFAVNVTGTAAGTHSNTTGTVASNEGGTGAAASAGISVEAPPVLAQAFGAPSIALGSSTTLTFTITNPAANPNPLTGVGFSNTLPAGLTVAGGTSAACGGTVTTIAPSSIALSGGTIATGGQCQFTVTVTGAAAGQFTNTTGAVTSSNGGSGASASASLTVATPPTVAIGFSASSIPLGGSTSLSFTVQNPNAALSLAGIAFSDSLPAGLVVATPPALTGSCGSGTISASAGASAVTLAGGSLAAGGSCVFSVNVTGASAGAKGNTTSAISATESGTGSTSNTAAITVVAPPTVQKAFGAPSIPLSGTTTLSLTVLNPNSTASLTGVSLTDTLPAGIAIASPNGLTNTCGGTMQAAAGGNSIVLAAVTLAPNASCGISVNIAGTAAGTIVDNSGPIASNEGGTGSAASASIIVVAPPVVSMAASQTLIGQGTSTNLVFTVRNPAVNTVPLTGVALSLSLPVGLTVPNGATAVCGGSLATTAPLGIALSSATIAAGSECQFSVAVTGAASGNYTATTGAVTSTNGGTGNTASANINVGVAVKISADPSGLAVSADGVTVPSGATLIWAVGSSHTISTISPQSNSSGTYLFASWSDGGTISHTVTADAKPATYLAVFSRKKDTQTIDFPVIPNQLLGAAPFTVPATASSGLPVTLTVQSGPATISGHTITVTGLGHVFIQATQSGNDFFEEAPPVGQSFSVTQTPVYTLTLASDPVQGGSATATPPGPDFSTATTVQVQAQAAAGYLFAGFSGDLTGTANPQPLLMSASRSVVAHFVAISNDARDQIVFGMASGGSVPSPQTVMQAGISSLAVIPGTGGNWLTAEPAANNGGVQFSVNSEALVLASGTYTSYVVASNTDGSRRAFTVVLAVNVAAASRVVDSAGYTAQGVAGQELVTLFGANLATGTAQAASLPLGTSLAGTFVTLTDSTGATFAAQLLYVSPGQINLLIPDGMAPGRATFTVTNAAGQTATGTVDTASVAPGIFTADATGSGAPAAVVQRVTADGDVITSFAASCDAALHCTPNTIDVSTPGEQVFLSLYGTGIRGRSSLSTITVTVGGIPVEVLYAGAQSLYVGLDQINVRLPGSLAGKGDVAVVVVVDGKAANTVTIRIR